MTHNTINDQATLVPSGSMAVFSREEFETRQIALRGLLAARGIDLLLVNGPENIFYLTGQQTPGYYTFMCLGIPVEGEPFILLRELESWNARANTYLAHIQTYSDNVAPGEALAALVEARGWKGRRIALERTAWFLPVALYEKLVESLGNLSDGSGLVESLRIIKSPREVAMIEKAARTTDAGMIAGMKAVASGATENTVAARMMEAAVEAGSEYMGMDPFVTSGPKAGIPHTTWRRRVLEPSDGVLLELAGCFNRYHAALMRTVWIGRAPDMARDMMRACEEALQAALDRVKPGNTCADVHNAAQAVIDRHGYGDNYRKRTGYGIGISFAPDWGEGNIVSLYHNVNTELRPGMCFHMPPALRDYGRFTVGVSETVLVTETGHRTCSTIPRGMLEI
jgi:Xaa-Pro dipeptidase